MGFCLWALYSNYSDKLIEIVNVCSWFKTHKQNKEILRLIMYF